MPDLFDDVERETIEVSVQSGGVKHVPAWRYKDLAVAQNPILGNKWVIVAMSMGHMFNLIFEAIEPAIAAMKEIHKLRNNWLPTDDDMTDGLLHKVCSIAAKHGGVIIDEEWLVRDRDKKYLTNGYRDELG